MIPEVAEKMQKNADMADYFQRSFGDDKLRLNTNKTHKLELKIGRGDTDNESNSIQQFTTSQNPSIDHHGAQDGREQ